MNTRFRLLIIVLGGLLIALTYSFPFWYPLLQNRGDTFVFPELDASRRDAFTALPPERQADYLALRRTNLMLALDMANTALQPDVVVPPENQVLPQISGQVETDRTGTLLEVTPNRRADGTVTIYELPDGSHYLWLTDFSAVQGPDLRLYLSTQTSGILADRTDEEEPGLTTEDIFLGRLEFNVGNQRFDIPREADLALYQSIIIYSQGLNLIYSMADI